MRTACALATASVLLAACGDSGGQDTPATRPDGSGGEGEGGSVAPPPPDAGTRAGHGGDRTRVVVPNEDRTPPEAVVSLADAGGSTLAEASQPGEGPEAVVRLDEPRVRATTVGSDEDSGVVRVRVSFSEAITCRRSSGATVRRRRTRYLPEPQIERINARPGARIATRDRRTVTLPVSTDRCPRGSEATAVRGELWGEAVNGLGLESVTPHISLEWRP